MRLCRICRYETELDDVVVGGKAGERCICLRCFNHQTGSHRPMPKGLSRQLQALLA
jgi:hypothetical protein